MTSAWNDSLTAQAIRDLVTQITVKTLALERPQVRYATVQSIDRANRKATVIYVGETSVVTVAMGSIQPNATGQVVRIGGPSGDRYIEDVLGASYQSGAGVLAFGTIAVAGQGNVVADSAADSLTLVAGTNVTLTTDPVTDAITISASPGSGGVTVHAALTGLAADDHTQYHNDARGDARYAKLSFSTIVVAGQSSVVADALADTLTFVAGTGISLTTDAATDTITVTALPQVHSALTGLGNDDHLQYHTDARGDARYAKLTFSTIAIAGQSNVVADALNDTLTLVAGTNVTLTTDPATDTITINASSTPGPTGPPGPSGAPLVWETFVDFTTNGWTSSGARASINAGGRNGTGLLITNDALANYGTCTYPVPAGSQSDIIVVGFAYKIDNFANSPRVIELYGDAGGTFHAALRIDNTGHLDYLFGGAYLGGSGANYIVANTWYYIEVRIKLGDGTSGSWELRGNGVKLAGNAATDTKNGGTGTAIDRIVLTTHAAGVINAYYDDLYIMTGTTAVFRGDNVGPAGPQGAAPSGASLLASLITVDGAGSGLDADLLDGLNSTYLLDFTNQTNKPSPVITVTLTGDVTGTANTTLTALASGTVTIATTIGPNTVALGTDTTGNYVATIAGTANQVNVSGSGSETAAIILSLPQDIHTGASPTFVRPTFSQPTGSSPFVVASTTKVTNLNADLLDGNDSAFFAQQALVESLLGDLLFVGLYDASTYVAGNSATLPHPNWELGTTVYRHAMYWVVSGSGEVDFVDSDLSGRYTDTDVPVTLQNGDWIVTVDPLLGTNGPGVNLPLSGVTFQYIPFSSENFMRSLLDEHAGNPNDPHSAAGYLTATTGGDIFAPIIHDHDADIQAALEEHRAELDPHPVYLTQDEATILYALIGHLHTGVYEPAGKVVQHEGKSDPHPQYTTQSETDALYALVGHLHDSRYAKIDQIPVVPKRVRSTDAGGESTVWIGSVSPATAFPAELKAGDLWYETFNVSLQAPAAPANFSANTAFATTVTLSWSAYASDIAQTEIQLDRETAPGSGIWTNILTDATAPFDVTKDDTGRLENTQYSYRIRGRNAVGYGPYSTLLVTTANDIPAAPTGLSVTAITATTLQLNWTASTALDLHPTQPYDIFLNGVNIGSDTASPYTFSGLVENTAYTLGIRAKDASGVVSSTVTISGTTANGTPPPPTGLVVSAGSYDRVTLSWTAPAGVTDVTQYEVYLGATLKATVSGLTYTFTGLAELTAYTLGVKSKDSGGLTSTTATDSYTTTANPDTTPPNNPTVTSLIPEATYGAVRFRGTWAATTAFATVQKSTNNSTWTTAVARTAVTAGATFNYAIGTYAAGTTCYVRTIVEDSAGNARTSGSTSYSLIESPTIITADGTNQWRDGKWGNAGNWQPYQGYFSDPAFVARGCWFYGTKPNSQLYYAGRRTITGFRFLEVREAAGGSPAVAPTLYMINETANPGTVTDSTPPTLYGTAQAGAAVTLPSGGANVAWTDLGAAWGQDLVDGVHRGIACYVAGQTPYMTFATPTQNSLSGALEFTHLG